MHDGKEGVKTMPQKLNGKIFETKQFPDDLDLDLETIIMEIAGCYWSSQSKDVKF